MFKGAGYGDRSVNAVEISRTMGYSMEEHYIVEIQHINLHTEFVELHTIPTCHC